MAVLAGIAAVFGIQVQREKRKAAEKEVVMQKVVSEVTEAVAVETVESEKRANEKVKQAVDSAKRGPGHFTK